MSNEDMQEYGQEQRAAICYDSWDKKDNKSNLKIRKNIITFKINASSDVRFETEGETTYLVAPVVAICEGIVNGEFVPAEEIAKSVTNWEGMPITIGHPDKGGMFVSLHENPELIETWVVGSFRNVKFKNDSLVGEIWINVEKVNETPEGEKALEILSSGGRLEVSTGYFAEDIPITGFYEGEEYFGSQRNLTPDHLALLPNDIGACSWEDGCGAPRQNDNKNEKETALYEYVSDGGENSIMPNKFLEAFSVIANFFGYKVHEDGRIQGIKVQGKNIAILLDKLIKDQITDDRPRRDIIKEMATQAGISKDKIKEILNGDIDFIPRRWLEGFASALSADMWDLMMVSGMDSFSFMEDNLPGLEEGSLMAFNKQSDEEVVIDDNKDEKVKMEEEFMDTKELIDALIGNENNALAEKDRETLESLTKEFLERLMPTEEEELETQEEHECECGEHVENIEEEGLVEEEVKVQEEELVEEEIKVQEDEIDEEDKEVDIDEYIANLPESVKTIVQSALEAEKAKRKDLIERITANSELSEEELEEESLEKLHKLASLAKSEPEPDFSGAGGPRSNVQDDSIPSPTPIMLAERKSG